MRESEKRRGVRGQEGRAVCILCLDEEGNPSDAFEKGSRRQLTGEGERKRQKEDSQTSTKSTFSSTCRNGPLSFAVNSFFVINNLVGIAVAVRYQDSRNKLDKIKCQHDTG